MEFLISEAKYGDFLFDISWLNFWSNDISYAHEFNQFYMKHKIKIDHFAERINCYSLHIGLHALIIAAYLNNMQDYEKVLTRLRRIIKI